jgi:hypothetical protein
MPSNSNKAIIAAAGSRKTQYIVDCVTANRDGRALVTTYTNENLRQLTNRIAGANFAVPSHVKLMGWFTFLLNECAKPYQSAVLGDVGLINGLNFVADRPMGVARDRNPLKYFLDTHGGVYRNQVSRLAWEANKLSGGKVVERIAEIYDHIYIDEIQDMAGYDLQLLEALLQSSIQVTMVGDPRQATFSTNTNAKNKRYKGSGIVDWLTGRSGCDLEYRSESYRCNQAICDFADGLYPDFERTVSKNAEVTGHDGVFCLSRDEVAGYVNKYDPVILRYNAQTKTYGFDAMNTGVSKGSTFDRVLLFPTKPWIKYFKTRDPADVGSREKLYVAVTRAKYSVAFVIP